jgi:hypothetical protein
MTTILCPTLPVLDTKFCESYNQLRWIDMVACTESARWIRCAMRKKRHVCTFHDVVIPVSFYLPLEHEHVD